MSAKPKLLETMSMALALVLMVDRHREIAMSGLDDGGYLVEIVYTNRYGGRLTAFGSARSRAKAIGRCLRECRRIESSEFPSGRQKDEPRH